MRRLIGLGLLSVLLLGAGEGDDPPEGAETEEQQPEEKPADAPPPPAQQPGGASSPEAAAAIKKAQSLEYQIDVWKVVSGSASAIDRCTERYLDEFPDQKGMVTIAVEVSGEGRVKSKATSKLQASRNLTVCLEDVARGWRFPALGPTIKLSSSLPVHVGKGIKFILAKPGEKPKPAATPQEQQSEGFVRFAPSFTPGWSE
jgi:hypothetical protein